MSVADPYAEGRAAVALLERLREQPALAGLALDGQPDWILALCDAWGALADVIGFYQERIAEEAFLATAEQPSSVELIYHSLGHRFPPNAAAATSLAYHLRADVAGVEAVSRARAAGGTGMSPQDRARLAAQAAAPAASAAGGSAGGSAAGAPPSPAAPQPGMPVPGGPGLPGAPGQPGAIPGVTPVGTPAGIAPDGTASAAASALALGTGSDIPPAAQVRGIPTAAGKAPVFVTLAPLDAYVGASRLAVDVPATAPPPALGARTTQLELAGTTTKLSVGQPVLVAATDRATGAPRRWVRLLTGVHADGARGSTRIAWEAPLGAEAGEPPAAGSEDAVVYGFARSSALVAANAPAWRSLTPARQLAVKTDDGATIPIRGGLARSADGRTWTLDAGGLPPGADLTAVAAYDDVTIVAAGPTLLRATAGAPFQPATVVGGSRRPVLSLGGTRNQMLAAAGGGVVYQSLDDGVTWSAIAGGPPQLLDIPSTSALAGARTRQVDSGQLPPVAVRCAIQDPRDSSILLAGTDAGLFTYAGSRWVAPTTPAPAAASSSPAPSSPPPPAPPPPLPPATCVYDLLVVGKTVLAATAGGVFVRTGHVWSTTPAGRLAQPVHALAEAGGTLYAATDTGLVANAGGGWQDASAGLPTGARVAALLAARKTLFAATDAGIYGAALGGAALAWKRADEAPAFALDGDAFQPPPETSTVASFVPPPGLVAAFSTYGVVLGDDARVAVAVALGGFRLTAGGHAYLLARSSSGDWQVTLLDALPAAAALAAAGDAILAVGSAAQSIADDWPGLAVAGATVELAPQVKGVAPQLPAIVAQRTTPALCATVLDVTAVEQDAGVRGGAETAFTRLTFAEPLAAGRFQRRVATVWTGATVLPLFDPPSSAVATLAGGMVQLASRLPAPLAAGRLATITGAPPGLVVAPLGGASRIASPGEEPASVGPSEADLTGVAIAPDGSVYLSGGEGVFAIAPAPAGEPDGGARVAAPELLGAGWPAGGSNGVAVAGAQLLAASSAGVQLLSPAGWQRAGDAVGEVLALAGDGTTVAASVAGGVLLRAADAASSPQAWATLPSLQPAPAALAVSGTTLYAANADGVFALAGERWSQLTAGSAPTSVACLLIAGGVLWAGGASGLHSWDPAVGEWRTDPGIAAPVEALCETPAGALVAAGPAGVVQRAGSGWSELAPPVGASLTALAGHPDGALWFAASASLQLVASDGTAGLALAHESLLSGAIVQQQDLATLAQGGVPAVLVAALADCGHALDPSCTVAPGDGPGCWLIRSGGDVYVVAARSAGGRTAICVHRTAAVAYPLAPATTRGGAQSWPVEAGGTAATLVAPTARVLLLAADADAPALAEQATVAAPGVQPAAAPARSGSSVRFAQPLRHLYDATTVQVNLNVVPAAQGQPRSLPIGSGDPQVPHQTFAVRTPIAAVPTGTADAAKAAAPTLVSTLRVYVDGQPWSEVASLGQAGPQDRVYVTRVNADGSASVSFGDGVHGALLPPGRDNVVATYLEGGGPDGEAAPAALIQALDRPQLVSAVHNPAPALVPVAAPPDRVRAAAVRRLDRTVTIGDYAELACAQPGVASATAEVIAGAPGRAVAITVALAAGAPADALERVAAAVGPLSSGGLPVRVVPAVPVAVAAAIEVVSAAPAAAVGARVRTALAGLGARRPGAPLLAAQAIAAATAVPGVVAARIAGWSRAGRTSVRATSLHAHGAAWPAAQPSPTGAELLAIDGSVHCLAIDVEAPDA